MSRLLEPASLFPHRKHPSPPLPVTTRTKKYAQLSLTAASTARAALEHSNFDSGGAGGGGTAGKRPPTSPVSPRYLDQHQQQIPMISPRFSRGHFHQQPPYVYQKQQPQQQHQQHQHSSSSASPPAGCASPRFSRRDGQSTRSPTRPPRSPPLAGESMTLPSPGYRGGGSASGAGDGGDGNSGGALAHAPVQEPFSPRYTGHPTPLAIPRSPASESVRNAIPANGSVGSGGGGSSQGSSGARRAQGVAVDVDARRSAVAARASAGGGVATWSWGRM